MGDGQRAHLFKPGQSGNAAGTSKAVVALRDFAQTKAMAALEVAAEVMTNTESSNADRLNAAKIILDRAMGKPQQAMELSGSVESPLSGFSKEQLLAWASKGK